MPAQLLLTYDFPPIGGGIARWMGELAKRYPASSLVVSTGRYRGSAETDHQYRNRVDRLPVSSRRLRTVQGLAQWSRRAAIIARSSRIEFTWCGNLKPAAYPALWVARRVGVPYGVLVHGGDLLILRRQIGRSVLKRQMSRALLKSASVMVANSTWTAGVCRSVLTDLGLDSRSERVRVVPLGSDPERFRPGLDLRDVRQRYGLDGRRWLMTVARLAPHKGVDTGLHVLAQLGESYPDLAYAVIGSGGELPVLERMAAHLGLSHRVRFLTGVPDRDLPGLYNCAEIYLGLSREMEGNAEGFGISLLEAAASGLPVVAGRSGGIPDAVRAGETGLLVDTQQPDEAAAAVRRLLDDRTLARHMGDAGRQAVERYYNWQRVADELAGIGHELGKRGQSEVAQ